MRRTKIIVTLGPATDSPEMIGRLMEAGVNVVRLNMSHAPHDWVRRVTADIRSAAQARGRYVAIMMDTQGPAIRTGDLPAALDLQPGQKFTLTVRGAKSEEVQSVDVNYENFVNDISVGDIVLVDNGTIHMKVLNKQANKIECEVLTPGKLGSRRHINLPGVKVSLPALTAKDLADIAVALELELDYLALSFVREAKDLLQLRAVLQRSPRPPHVIAKIEDQQAIQNLDSIVTEADAIMIARGDLGIECPYEELPIIQRRIAKTCQQIGRPFIVATHMLESMIQNPLPTRAEVTDVANAVFEQADAIMLSGETTVGQYPLRCVEVLDRIAVRLECSGGAGFQDAADLTTPRQKLVKSAVAMANDLKADAIVVQTLGGRIARHTSWMRPRYSPIHAFCQDERVARALALCWGVKPSTIPFDETQPDATLGLALASLKAQGVLRRGSTVVVIGAIASGNQIVDAVQMRTLE
ncbi:MAG: pyruvate kinase [Limisphaerales bacterium]